MLSDPSASVEFADLILHFPKDAATGRVGLELFPAALRGQMVARRDGLAGEPFIDAMPGAGNPPAAVVESLVQVKVVGDAESPGFAQGHTMRNAATTERFRFTGRQTTGHEGDGRHVVQTTLRDADRKHRIEHRLAWHEGDAAATVTTEFHNDSDRPVTLEMLSSFSLGGITPFHMADAPGRLRVHRFRSGWSAEGRLVTESIEALHLERSWSGAGGFSERFGQVGTMPVRRWFPFVAVEDTMAGVVWGAQLAWAGSWQMEVFRQHDAVCLSGGLADRSSVIG